MPPFPQELDYLWRAYHRLRHRTGMGFASANPLSWHDIDAFVRQTGLRLAPWEIEAIESVDNAFLQMAPKPALPQQQQDLAESAPVNDPQAVKSLLRSIGKQRSNKRGG